MKWASPVHPWHWALCKAWRHLHPLHCFLYTKGQREETSLCDGGGSPTGQGRCQSLQPAFLSLPFPQSSYPPDPAGDQVQTPKSRTCHKNPPALTAREMGHRPGGASIPGWAGREPVINFYPPPKDNAEGCRDSTEMEHKRWGTRLAHGQSGLIPRAPPGGIPKHKVSPEHHWGLEIDKIMGCVCVCVSVFVCVCACLYVCVRERGMRE